MSMIPIKGHLDRRHLMFVESQQEADTLVLLSYYLHEMSQSGKRQLCYLKTEKHRWKGPLKRLASLGIEAKELDVDRDGICSKELFVAQTTSRRIGCIALSTADPLTRIIQPIDEIVTYCAERGLYLYLDMTPTHRYIDTSHLPIHVAMWENRDKSLSQKKIALFFAEPEQRSYIDFREELLEDIDDSKWEQPFFQTKSPDLLFEESERKEALVSLIESLGGIALFPSHFSVPDRVVCAFRGIYGELLQGHLLDLKPITTISGSNLCETLNDMHLDPSTACEAVVIIINQEITQIDWAEFAESFQKKVEQARRFAVDVSQITWEPMRHITEASSPACLKQAVKSMSVGMLDAAEGTSKGLRLCRLQRVDPARGLIVFYLFVDEEDGVIADATYQVYGPAILAVICDIVSSLVLRKNYLQVERMTAHMIEKELASLAEQAGPWINCALEPLEDLVPLCLDIPINDSTQSPPFDPGSEQALYPGWEMLDASEKKEVIAEVIEKEIQPYVALDAGGVEVISVQDNRVTIAYRGNCTTCFSATSSTLEAIGNILRHRVYPDLVVLPDPSSLQL